MTKFVVATKFKTILLHNCVGRVYSTLSEIQYKLKYEWIQIEFRLGVVHLPNECIRVYLI